MSRSNSQNEYVLRVNLKHGSDLRRFCEVHIKGEDLYVFQPNKNVSTKVSYHESGQKHVKVGSGEPIIKPLLLDPLKAIRTEESVWSKDFKNFNDLLVYSGQPADDIFEIEYMAPSVDSINFAEIAVGRSFGDDAWIMDGVAQEVLQQKLFSVPQPMEELQVCVRVLRLLDAVPPS